MVVTLLADPELISIVLFFDVSPDTSSFPTSAFSWEVSWEVSLEVMTNDLRCELGGQVVDEEVEVGLHFCHEAVEAEMLLLLRLLLLLLLLLLEEEEVEAARC